jgi:hypothetical protein
MPLLWQGDANDQDCQRTDEVLALPLSSVFPSVSSVFGVVFSVVLSLVLSLVKAGPASSGSIGAHR